MDEIFAITDSAPQFSYDDILNMSMYEKQKLVNFIEKKKEKRKSYTIK